MHPVLKVPASVLLLIVLAAFFFVMLPLCAVLTMVWLPLSMGGVLDCDPPAFWPIEATCRVFDWWAGL